MPVPWSRTPESCDERESVLAGKRAVVAEDEGVTQLQLQRILRSEGVEIVGVAANGQEAIEAVLKYRPDFVLMDIRMPGMDGLEATRRILEKHRICIILLTAFSEEEYRRQAEDLGAAGYILKPVTSGMLIPKIVHALASFSDS
jgi:response regulator NasT